MASTFSEMYSDFIDAIKIYTPNPDVTELAFMRSFTKGIQKFQLQTELLETIATLTWSDTPPHLLLPDNFIRPLLLQDVQGRTLLFNTFEQKDRHDQVYFSRYNETPTDYDMKLRAGVTNIPSRMATIYGDELRISPHVAELDTSLTLYYIPDIPAINEQDPLWAAWFPYDTNFLNMFNTSQLSRVFRPYEDIFKDYAVAVYLKSRSNQNYLVYEMNYKKAITDVIANKPTLFKEGVRDYMMSPYS